MVISLDFALISFDVWCFPLWCFCVGRKKPLSEIWLKYVRRFVGVALRFQLSSFCAIDDGRVHCATTRSRFGLRRQGTLILYTRCCLDYEQLDCAFICLVQKNMYTKLYILREVGSGMRLLRYVCIACADQFLRV
jgi:hypothetical protein